MVPVMVTWHTYKQVSFVVFRQNYHIIVKMIASFSPGSTYFSVPSSLKHCTLYLSLIRLSFPIWGPYAKLLLADIEWGYRNPQTLIILSNLIIMAEYFIPLVSQSLSHV